jgi:hypothetical protein
MQKELQVTIKGFTPLLMHNGQIADPLNEHAIALKKVSAKRTKTETDHLEMQKLEWFGGLYVDEHEHVIIPGANIESAIIAGAKKSKKGNVAKATILIDDDPRVMAFVEQDKTVKLIDINKTATELYAEGNQYIDRRMVRVTTSRIARTRPIFRKWALTFTIKYDESMANEDEVLTWLADAGTQVGLGDYRPKYGRFAIIDTKR